MQKRRVGLGDLAAVAGFYVFILSALAMVVLWIQSLGSWMGWNGWVLGVVTAPLGVIQPFAHWIVTGSPTPLYFAIWGLGLVGMCFSMWWRWWRG